MQNEILLPQSKKQLMLVMNNGKETMEKIREIIQRMQMHENILLDKTRKENNRVILLTPLFHLFLSILAIGLLLISYYAMMNELSKRQAFETELRNKIEELNRSNIDLEQFAYVASHDLQEPLRKIRSFSDRLVMKHAPSLDQDAQITINKIQNAAGRMQVLIDDLLSFSRLINQKGKTETTDLNTLLKEVLADMEVSIRNKNAKIFSGPLPELKVIPSLIRQLFQNLISNSLKFSKPDVQPVISMAATQVKGIEISDVHESQIQQMFHMIEFRDNGIGFEEKYLDRIFIIFQRLHGKMEYDGTGIGLAVCKKIMLIHQGYITATSSPDNGATFKLYFPA
jgi:light-regulated signal transduction histidine kinase (bacteriophytochrome)